MAPEDTLPCMAAGTFQECDVSGWPQCDHKGVLTMERGTSESNNQRKKKLNFLLWTFQVAPVEKNLPTNAGDLGDLGLIPGSRGSLEEGMITHSSILTWRIHGQRNLVDCSPQGCKESDMTEVTEHTHLALNTEEVSINEGTQLVPKKSWKSSGNWIIPLKAPGGV